MSKDKQIFSVGGYGHSGGTALKDFFREIYGCSVVESEFRLIKDPYGLMDLENNIVSNWRNLLNTDVYIKDFLWLIENLNRKETKFSKGGLNYKKQINENFLKFSEEFINKIIEFKYKGFWHLLLFKRNWFTQIYCKVRKKVDRDYSFVETMYYSSPDKKLFIDQARLYMDKLFSDFKGDVVLQNAIDTYYPEQGLSFFNSAKMIIIDRDPRDIYVEVINSKDLSYLGELFLTQQDVKKFVLDFKKRRKRQDEFYKNKNILIIRFESLIMDYNNTLSEIFAFSNFAADSHISPYSYFNPEISIKNIGIWKTYKYQDEIEYIYNELKDYCYEE